MGSEEFDASDAMPGTDEKLRILADRICRGMPLWHASDRADMEAPPLVRRSRPRRKRR
jgi:hypothetical protein